MDMDATDPEQVAGMEPLPPVSTYSALTLLVRALVEEKQLTLSAVARRSGLPLSTVGAYHSGQATGERARAVTIVKLARGLGVDPNELYAQTSIGGEQERALVALFQQLPTEADKRQALATLRAHVKAARTR